MIKFTSKITRSVLNHFLLQEGAPAHINELARLLHLDSGNLTRKLKELEQEGVLKSDLKGHQRSYSLNSAYPLLNEYRNIALKSMGLEFLLKKAAAQIPKLDKVFIFGSYATQTMDKASDIDILAIGNHDSLELQREIARIQKQTNRDINLINLSRREFDKKKSTDPFLKALLQRKKVTIK